MKLRTKLILVAIVGIVAVLGVALPMTSRPEFCRSCHEMKNDYHAWQTSAHKEVSCVSCHIEPGMVSFVQHKIVSLKEVASHITNGFEVPINKSAALSEEMLSSQCSTSSCHKSPGRESNGRVIFEHDKHKEAKLSCAYCHNRVAHPGLEGYKSRISMALCIDCHIKQDGPDKCDTCHPANFELKPASHAKETWLKGHGKKDISGCSDCHFNTDRFCTGCHGLEMPHPASWNGSHGKNQSLLGLCNKCHEKQTFCTKCHEMR